jgi:hypothetical protein
MTIDGGQLGACDVGGLPQPRVHAIPNLLDARARMRSHRICRISAADLVRIEPGAIERLQGVGEIEHPLQVIRPFRRARRNIETAFRMSLRQHHRKGGAFGMRLAVDDERWDHPVGIEPKIIGAFVRPCRKIHQARLEGHAKLDEYPVDRQARPAGRIMENVHGSRRAWTLWRSPRMRRRFLNPAIQPCAGTRLNARRRPGS